jgi:hypothetical protein
VIAQKLLHQAGLPFHMHKSKCVHPRCSIVRRAQAQPTALLRPFLLAALARALPPVVTVCRGHSRTLSQSESNVKSHPLHAVGGRTATTMAASSQTTSYQEVLRQTREEEEEERREEEERNSGSSAGATPAAASLPQIVRPAQPSGWLIVDEGPLAGGESKKRWCFLKRAFLFHTESQKKLTHPKGVLDLKGCTVGLARASTTAPGAPPFLPCAFVISHPRRPSVIFTAASEQEREFWTSAVRSALTGPTIKLLSYKGRDIFDEEDAQAISASQQAIQGFVKEQFNRLNAKKHAIADRVARKKADVKTLKAQKKSLATKLIALSKQYEEVAAQSDDLSQALTSVQRDARTYDAAQRAFFLQLVSILNDLDESDINRWISAGSNTNARNGSDDEADTTDEDEDPDDVDANPRYRNGSSRAAAQKQPRKEHPADRAARNMRLAKGQQQVTPQIGKRFGSATPHTLPPTALLESELIDSGWTPNAPASQLSLAHDAFSQGQPAYGSSPVRRAGFIPGGRGGPRLAPAPQSTLSAVGHGGIGIGGALANKLQQQMSIAPPPSARTKGKPNIGEILGSGEDAEASAIELSNEQLQHVQDRITALLAAPINSSHNSDALRSAMAASNYLSTSMGTSIMGSPMGVSMEMASHQSPDSLLDLSRNDVLELEEIRKSTLELVSSSVALRLEQNLLSHYIDAWLRRKHAIALQRME